MCRPRDDRRRGERTEPGHDSNPNGKSEEVISIHLAETKAKEENRSKLERTAECGTANLEKSDVQPTTPSRGLRSAQEVKEALAKNIWYRLGKGEGGGLMGNSQGRDNVKKRAARRKKTERLAAAKKETAKKAAKK